MTRDLPPRVFLLAVIPFITSTLACAARADEPVPATIADAAALIDLSRWKIDGMLPAGSTSLAQWYGEVTGSPTAVHERVKTSLTATGWTEQGPAYVTEQYVSTAFTRSGFTVSVSINPSTAEGKSTLTIINHGNVDVRKLPVPPGATPLYSGPFNALFVTGDSPADAGAALSRILQEQGWQPYGSAGDVSWYKRNGIQLSARAVAAPAQGGKTVIDYSTRMLSGELPAPPQFERLQYSDAPLQLSVDTRLPETEVVPFYRAELGKTGWQATTEHPLQSGFRKELIFRNAGGDMLTLEWHEADSLLRLLLTHMSAEQVTEQEARAKARIEADRAKQAETAPQLDVPLPAAARDVQRTVARIEFQLASGSAREILSALRKTLKKQGWKEREAMVDAHFGTLELTQDDKRLLIDYVDPGLIPAEVTFSAHGFEFADGK